MNIDESRLPQLLKETDEYYNKAIKLLEEVKSKVVDPSYLTCHYHYSIFLFDLANRKEEAILKMQTKQQAVVDNLDVAYKHHIESYEIIDLIRESMTNWIISTNYQNVNHT